MPKSTFFLEKLGYPFLSSARYDAHDSSLKVQKGRLTGVLLSYLVVISSPFSMFVCARTSNG